MVEAVGAQVANVKAGDEVIGFSHTRSSQAEYVVVPAEQLTRKPAQVSWEQAGGLFVAGTTAYASVRAVAPKPGETIVVAGAAGGVGSLAAQLAKNAGAKVIGIASEANQAWLSARGITPVAYGDGLAERIRAAAGPQHKIDAFIDTFGKGYVDLAISLGVAHGRINTIIDFEAAKKHGVKTEGSAAAANATVLGELAAAIAEGKLEVPIARTFPLSEVKDAYRELIKRHTRGKIVLIP